MPLEPQKQYIHQEYPKIIGYRQDGKAIIARSEAHHAELVGTDEPASKTEASVAGAADAKPEERNFKTAGELRRRERIARELAKAQARIIEEERGGPETENHQADPQAAASTQSTNAD